MTFLGSEVEDTKKSRLHRSTRAVQSMRASLLLNAAYRMLPSIKEMYPALYYHVGSSKKRGKLAAELVVLVSDTAKYAREKRFPQFWYILSLCRSISGHVPWNFRETNADPCAYIVLKSVVQGVGGFGKVLMNQKLSSKFRKANLGPFKRFCWTPLLSTGTLAVSLESSTFSTLWFRISIGLIGSLF